MIRYNNAQLEGASLVDLYRVSADKEARELTPAVTKTGGADVYTAVYFDDAPQSIAYARLPALAGALYTVYGEAYPVGTTVYLSALPDTDSFTIGELVSALVASTEAGSDGSYSFSNVESTQTLFLVWVRHSSMTLDDAASYSVTANGEVTLEATNAIQYVALELPVVDDNGDDHTGELETLAEGKESGAMEWPELVIAGSRPAGVSCAVNVTRLAAGEDISETTLLQDGVLKVSSEEETGDYAVTFDGSYRPTEESYDYVVWCYSETEGLTAAYTQIKNKSCLAGDTRITLADGGTRRLDAVQPGDQVLAGDGTPTRVLRTERGEYNVCHTLYTFADGTVVDEIHAHRFYNVEQGFWQLLGRWKLGEHARRQDGADVALVSRRVVAERKEMFGLWTASRDYWANGLLSGETAANQTLLADATAAQAADMLASLDAAAAGRLMKGELG